MSCMARTPLRTTRPTKEREGTGTGKGGGRAEEAEEESEEEEGGGEGGTWSGASVAGACALPPPSMTSNGMTVPALSSLTFDALGFASAAGGTPA